MTKKIGARLDLRISQMKSTPVEGEQLVFTLAERKDIERRSAKLAALVARDLWQRRQSCKL
jgi:hypothetical protein